MGEEVTKQNGRTGAETEPVTKRGRKGTGSNDTGTSKEPGTGTGRTGNGTGRTDTETTDSKGQSKKPLELAEVDVSTTSPIPQPETAPAKKRTRKKRTVKKSAPVFSSTQITTLIMAVSGIFASREGMEVFALSETEAQQIAEPLSQIIVETGYSEAVGKYGNYIALATACLMIFAPRFILFSQQQKAKKIQKQGGLKVEPVNKDNKNNGNGGTDNKSVTPTKQTNDTSILSTIPSLA